MFSALILYAWSKKIWMIPTAFYRTPEQQNRLFNKGKSKCDGYSKISNHQKWQAGDLLNLSNPIFEPIWVVSINYDILGKFWEAMGGTWGGSWINFIDQYHFEIK